MPSNVSRAEWFMANNKQTQERVGELVGREFEFTVGAAALDIINVAIQVLANDGLPIDYEYAFYAWLSGTDPLAAATAVNADVAIGTDGLILEELTTDASFWLLTNAAGAIDLDIGETTATNFYLNIRKADGTVVSSPVLAFPGP
jgi:hypothetical protein